MEWVLAGGWLEIGNHSLRWSKIGRLYQKYRCGWTQEDKFKLTNNDTPVDDVFKKG